MDYQNLMPQQAQPISRITNGQLPSELAELSEEVLDDSSDVLPSNEAAILSGFNACSYDGDDAE